jgi:hypothetical protein
MEPITTTLPWWQRKTVWSGFFVGLFAILNGLGVLPADMASSLDPTVIDEGIEVAIGIIIAITHALGGKTAVTPATDTTPTV